MLDYNVVHILTAPLFIYAQFLLIKTFFKSEAKNTKIEVISFFIYFIISALRVLVTRTPVTVMIINVILTFIISFNYIETLTKRVFYTTFIYSIGVVVELIVSYSILYYDFEMFQISEFNSSIGLIIVRTSSIIVTYLINKYSNIPSKDFKLPKVYYLGILVILCGTLYLFMLSLQVTYINMINLVISSIVLIVVNLTLMFIDEKIYKSLISSAEQKTLKQQNEAFVNQANISSDATMYIKSLKHDMKDHLSLLNELFQNDKKEEFEQYINKFNSELNNNKLSDSGNFIFDSIINLKLKKLADSNAYIKLDINIEPNINILAYDLTIILGNLLENAITAVLNADEKTLSLSISQSKGNIIIFIDNTYRGELIKVKNQYKTTKLLKINHGFGLSNVEKVLENYNGELRISHTESIFSVAVIIPCS